MNITEVRTRDEIIVLGGKLAPDEIALFRWVGEGETPDPTDICKELKDLNGNKEIFYLCEALSVGLPPSITLWQLRYCNQKNCQ